MVFVSLYPPPPWEEEEEPWSEPQAASGRVNVHKKHKNQRVPRLFMIPFLLIIIADLIMRLTLGIIPMKSLKRMVFYRNRW
ncbi:hypothetical protein D3C76_1592460 [compost metagenome]